MLFKRVDTVFLPVRDIDRASAWYVDVLGWELAWKNDCVACLKGGETALTLLQYGYPGHTEKPDDYQFAPNTHVSFNFYVADIAAAYQSLAAKGVELSEINDYGSVKDFLFTDLDGNRLSAVTW